MCPAYLATAATGMSAPPEQVRGLAAFAERSSVETVFGAASRLRFDVVNVSIRDRAVGRTQNLAESTPGDSPEHRAQEGRPRCRRSPVAQ
jgi:hypothetical protein